MKYTLMLIFTLLNGEVEMYPLSNGYKSWDECNGVNVRTLEGTPVIDLHEEIESVKTKCVLELEA